MVKVRERGLACCGLDWTSALSVTTAPLEANVQLRRYISESHLYLFYLYHCGCYRYVLNYVPYGVVYKACNLLPIKLVIVSLREVFRAKQIHTGFVYVSTNFPTSSFVIAVYSIILGVQPVATLHMHMHIQCTQPIHCVSKNVPPFIF